MKTFLPLLLAGFLGATAAHAQDSVSFKIHFLPQTIYTETYTQRMDVHMDFEGSSQGALVMHIGLKADMSMGVRISPAGR
jgi:hypothetical protein